VPDTTPPTIAFHGLADGASVSNGFEVDFDVNDDRQVASVELWVNDMKLTSKTAAPWSFPVTAGSIPTGSAKIKGVAYDGAHNMSQTPDISVNIKKLGDTPGDLGTICTPPGMCNGGSVCDTVGGSTICTRDCSPSNSCPIGFDCVSSNFSSKCAPSHASDSGCSAAVGGPREAASVLSMLGLCAFALLLARRRVK
jgi:hypothetical protein